MRTTTRIRAAVTLVFVLAACGARPRDADGDTLDADVDVLKATVMLEIGEAEGEPAYLFGQVSGLTLDADGRIYVADGQANEVRVFAPDGTHLFSFGRKGSGPGELRRPCCLAFDRAGRLWVRRSVAQGQPNEADVYGVDGKLAARVTWPARVSLGDGFVDLERALGTTTDSRGVTRVVLLEFGPAVETGGR